MIGGQEHILVAGGPNLACMWPRYGGIWRWGEEILCAFVESPCAYRHPPEAARDLHGVWKRGCIRLRRSMDGGRTWADEGKIFDHSISFDRQRQILQLGAYHGHTLQPRDSISSDTPDSVLLMGRAWCGEEVAETRHRHSVAYCIRSSNRGRNWESLLGIVQPCHVSGLVPHAGNILNLGGGTLAAVLTACEGSEGAGRPVAYHGLLLYRSEDHGANWHFYSEICRDPEMRLAYSFARIIVLPSGRWLCFAQAGAGADTPLSWTVMTYSDDEGHTWSAPRNILGWSSAPYPLRLNDGRLTVFFMRCAPDPVGLYAIGSDDDGMHWSAPACLRRAELVAGATSSIDMGYPVAVETSENRILVLYDWQHNDEDVPWYGGRHFIAGTWTDRQ